MQRKKTERERKKPTTVNVQNMHTKNRLLSTHCDI